MKTVFTPIGIIRTPFQKREGMPIQPKGAKGVHAQVEVLAPFHAGLKDLEGFSHIILIYHFHRVAGYELTVVPYMDRQLRGVFATRAPKRPNAIGLSVVRLDRIENGVLYIQNVDILDGTPLLDIKPYVPEFDRPVSVRIGWLEDASKSVSNHRSDDRFK